MQVLEAVAAAVAHQEPVLLTGETGTGKTSMVQHLAGQVGAKMVVVNLNQQSETGDLLGGFKPVEVRVLAQELMDDLMVLSRHVCVCVCVCVYAHTHIIYTRTLTRTLTPTRTPTNTRRCCYRG